MIELFVELGVIIGMWVLLLVLHSKKETETTKIEEFREKLITTYRK